MGRVILFRQDNFLDGFCVGFGFGEIKKKMTKKENNNFFFFFKKKIDDRSG